MAHFLLACRTGRRLSPPTPHLPHAVVCGPGCRRSQWFHLLILIGPDVFFCSQGACWAWFCSLSLCGRPKTLGRRCDERRSWRRNPHTHSGCKSSAGEFWWEVGLKIAPLFLFYAFTLILFCTHLLTNKWSDGSNFPPPLIQMLQESFCYKRYLLEQNIFPFSEAFKGQWRCTVETGSVSVLHPDTPLPRCASFPWNFPLRCRMAFWEIWKW